MHSTTSNSKRRLEGSIFACYFDLKTQAKFLQKWIAAIAVQIDFWILLIVRYAHFCYSAEIVAF
ncbi:MAG: hypothetical protein RIR11_4024 [Bacteroidota bacterium]|jgi:hypothetical protein